ncbi:MAG TPA: hypothetical protein VFX60_06140 [Micromonospora sp.]|nr:hypothetical protein [Micromonospora sp.]
MVGVINSRIFAASLVTVVAVVLLLGLPGVAAAYTTPISGTANGSGLWVNGTVERCYYNGQGHVAFKASDLPEDSANTGKLGLRILDKSKSAVWGTRSGINNKTTWWDIASGPSGQNNCGVGYNAFYIGHRKESASADNTWAGTLRVE